MSKTKIKNHYHKREHYLFESEFRKFNFFIEKITDWCPDYIKVAFLLQLLYDSFFSS